MLNWWIVSTWTEQLIKVSRLSRPHLKWSATPTSIIVAQLASQRDFSRPMIVGKLDNHIGNLTFVNCTFTRVKARVGGAIYLGWDKGFFCSYSLQNLVFQSNEAREEGGAIFYTLYRPEIINVTYSGNSAPYGPNIGSYPVKVILTDTNSTTFSLSGIASGQVYPGQIRMSVVDVDNQITNSKGSVFINPIESGTNTLGRNSEGLVSGTATFKDIIFLAKPGMQNVKFEVSTNSIDKSKMLKQFGKCSSVIFRYYFHSGTRVDQLQILHSWRNWLSQYVCHLRCRILLIWVELHSLSHLYGLRQLSRRLYYSCWWRLLAKFKEFNQDDRMSPKRCLFGRLCRWQSYTSWMRRRIRRRPLNWLYCRGRSKVWKDGQLWML